MSEERCSECGVTDSPLEYGMCAACANSEWDSEELKLRPRRAKELYDSLFTQARTEEDLCRMVADAEAEITALRAENARLAQWTDNAQERVFQSLEKVDALRAALDQERADNERLRALLRGVRYDRKWCDFEFDDIDGRNWWDVRDALLSGRGEGGNDG